MAYGSEILSSDGRVWMTPDVMPLIYQFNTTVSGFNATTIKTINTSVPTSRACIAFTQCLSDPMPGRFAVLTYMSQANGVWQVNVRGNPNISVKIYVFANVVVPTSRYGIQYFNSAGVETYNANCIPVQIYQMAPGFGNWASTSFSSVAVLAAVCGLQRMYVGQQPADAFVVPVALGGKINAIPISIVPTMNPAPETMWGSAVYINAALYN